MTPKRRRLIWALAAALLAVALLVLAGLGFAHLSLRQGEEALAALSRDPLPRSADAALALYRRAQTAFDRASLSPLHRARARGGRAAARRAMGDLVERGFASGQFSPRDASRVLGILPSLGWGPTARAELSLGLGRFPEALREVSSVRSAEACRLGLAAALALADTRAIRRHLLCLDGLAPSRSPWEREVRGLLWLVLDDPGRALPLLRRGTASPDRLPLLAEAERRAGRPAEARKVIEDAYEENELAQPLLRLAFLRTLAHGPKAPEALPWLAARLPQEGEGERSPVDATQQALYAAVLARHGQDSAARRRLRRFLADAPVPAADAKAPWLPLYALQSRFRRGELRYLHPDDLAPPIGLAESLLAQAGADAAAAEPFRECLWRLHLLRASAALLLLDAALADQALDAAERHGAPGQVLRFHRAVTQQVRGDPGRLEAALEALARDAPAVARPWQALLALASGDETRARTLLSVPTEAQRAQGPALGRYLHRLAETLLFTRKAGQGRVPALSPTLSADWPRDPVALRRDLSREVLAAPRGLAAPPEAVFVLLASHPGLRAEAPALFAAPGVPKIRPGEQLLRAHLTWLWARARQDAAAVHKAEALLARHQRLARLAPFYSAWWSLFLW